ncbi:hypothetical protein ACFL2H_14045, partial [Planctomycetota bacterium]
DSILAEDRTKRVRADSIVNFVDGTDDGVDDTYLIAIASNGGRYGLQLTYGYSEHPESLVTWGLKDKLTRYATAGQEISVSVEGIGPGPFRPLQIEVADPSNEIASFLLDDDGTIEFTASATGDYTVSLNQNYSSAQYQLHVTGDTPRPFGPRSSDVHLGFYPELTELPVEFTKTVRHAAGLATIDGNPFPIHVSGRTASIMLPELEEGTHTLAFPANALSAVDGVASTEVIRTFVIDNTPPTATVVDLQPNEVRPVGLNDFTVTFDEDVVRGTLGSISVRRLSDSIDVSRAFGIIDGRNIRVTADINEEGTYHLAISRYEDKAGHAINNVVLPFIADGFTEKNGTAPKRTGLDGSLAARSTPVGSLYDASDKDSGSVDLLAGQTISVKYTVREAAGATTMTVRRDGQPIPILKLDTTSPSETVAEHDFRVSESGPYVLEFTGDGTAHYEAELIVNQLFVPLPRPLDRPTAMNLDDALAISSDMISLRGNIEFTEQGSADWFKLTASPGELLSVVVSDIESSDVTLELFADSDTAVATGSPNNIWNGASLEHIVPDGDGPVERFIRVTGIAAPYTLTVAKNSRFEYLSSVGFTDGFKVIGSLGQPTPGKLFISSQLGIYETRPNLDGVWPVFNRIIPDSFRENDTGLAATPHSLLFVNGWGRIMEIDMRDGSLLRTIPFRTTLAETSTSNLRA